MAPPVRGAGVGRNHLARPVNHYNQTYAQHRPDVELEYWNTMEIQVHGDRLFRNLLNGTEVNWEIPLYQE